MSTPATKIVHRLNELIAEAETLAISADMDRSSSLILSENHKAIIIRDHYRRAVGQLKAARTSIMSANNGRAA